MKTVCLFGDLEGYPYGSEQVIKSVGDLKAAADKDKLVVVSHGMPGGDVLRVDPLLLEIPLHSFLLVQSGSSPRPDDLPYLKNKLAETCPRVYGLTKGWNKLEPDERQKVLEFLSSDDPFPVDGDLRRLLGYDSPVSKLALRIALEIALRELDGRSTEKPPAVNLLLSPALTIAEREPSLAQSVRGIRDALTSDRENLQQEVNRALAELRP